MPKITIRDVDEDTKRTLQVMAAMHGRSMEAEVREILRYHLRGAPPLMPEPYPPVAPDPEAQLAPDQDPDPDPEQNLPHADDREVPLAVAGEELISNINRQLEKLGLGEFALPPDLQLG